MMLLLYVKDSHAENITNISVDTVGTGIMGKLGNKVSISGRKLARFEGCRAWEIAFVTIQRSSFVSLPARNVQFVWNSVKFEALTLKKCFPRLSTKFVFFEAAF